MSYNVDECEDRSSLSKIYFILYGKYSSESTEYGIPRRIQSQEFCTFAEWEYRKETDYVQMSNVYETYSAVAVIGIISRCGDLKRLTDPIL